MHRMAQPRRRLSLRLVATTIGRRLLAYLWMEIMEAIDTMRRESVVTKTDRYIPITLVGVTPHVRDILRTIILTL